MPRSHRIVALLLAAAGIAALLSACGGGTATGGSGTETGTATGPATSTPPGGVGGAGHADASPIPVVAATNVWGDIAAQIGGGRVRVTSLIHDLGQDPHEFEPSGRDQLAVSRAKVVIINGGGYDQFLDTMLGSLGRRPIVVTAFDVASGLASVDPDNEHLWFNLDAVAAVAQAIGRAFTEVDPAARATFAGATTDFVASLAPARQQLARIARADAHVPVAVTEPLPLYLTAAAGLDNVMPASFTKAVEEGIDVAPSDMAGVLALFSQRRVKLLLYNEQTISAQTQQVLRAAADHDVPVLPVSEILPPGEHYQQWVGALAGSMSKLLGGAAA